MFQLLLKGKANRADDDFVVSTLIIGLALQEEKNRNVRRGNLMRVASLS